MNFPDVNQKKGEGGLDGGVFLKLKDGDKIRGVFMGNPDILKIHWPKGENSSLCTGKDQCALCKSGDKSKFRFRINFVTKVDEVWVAKVWEQGYGIYLDLKEMHENDYPLNSTLVTLHREGEDKDTRYRIMPVKDNGGLKPANFATLAKIPLNKLTEEPTEDAGAKQPTFTEDDIPF